METNLHSSIVDSILLDVLKQKGLIDVGISYYQFLVKNNYDLTVPTQTYFLQLFEHKKTIKEEDKECILNIYKHFISKYKSFEITMSNTLVKTLCNIGEWEKAIEVIKKFEINDQTFLYQAYNTLISYLYDYGKADKAYEYLLICFKRGSSPLEHVYTSYIKYHLKDKFTVNEKIEELFSLWRQYGINPSKETIQEYIEVCNDLGWSAKQTKLEGLQCTVCKQELLQTLSDKDYERLCKVTEQKLIFDHLYYVSNPKEINKFINFVKNGKPYDVVIDGLNFIYASTNGYQQLEQNLIYHRKKGKKVLIIGKKHMRKSIMKMNLQKLAHYFFVDNSSKDDLFILYAAFASGKNAKIFSNDLMRQHKYAITDVEVNTLFKRWQISQQYNLKNDVQNMNKLTEEIPIDAIVQKQLSCWHIPYMCSSSRLRQRHTSNDNWVCFNMCP
ncbi:Mitochondrial ribonuclease P catalytic subunit [Anthophora plagiata]